MKDFKPSFSRKPFGGKPGRFGGSGGGFSRGPKQMYQAQCSKCGDSCEVPFRPNGSKPVFCKNCFSREGGNDFAPRREFSPRREFAPRTAPAERQAPRDDRALQDVKEELRGVNEKLERLIGILTPATSVAAAPKATVKAAPKATVKAKVAKKKKASK